MNTIKLNNTTYEVLSFNRNTYFGGEEITSTASCQIKTTDISSVHALAQTTISTLQIYHDNTLIYNLTGVNGKLNSMDEYLMNDQINITINLNLNETVTSADE